MCRLKSGERRKGVWLFLWVMMWQEVAVWQFCTTYLQEAAVLLMFIMSVCRPLVAAGCVFVQILMKWNVSRFNYIFLFVSSLRWIILTEIKNSRVFVSFNHHVVSSLTLLHAAPRRRRPTFTPAIQILMTKSPRSSTFRSDRWPAATAAAPLPQRRSSKLPWGRLRCHPTEGRSSRLALISFKWGYIWDVHVNPPQNSLKTYS